MKNLDPQTKRIPLINGEEQDCFTKWRRYYSYLKRSGVTKRIKRKYQRRLRRFVKDSLRRI